jgi:hypothetical protein
MAIDRVKSARVDLALVAAREGRVGEIEDQKQR